MTKDFDARFASPRTPYFEFAPRARKIIDELITQERLEAAGKWLNALTTAHTAREALNSTPAAEDCLNLLSIAHQQENELYRDPRTHPLSALLPELELDKLTQEFIASRGE